MSDLEWTHIDVPDQNMEPPEDDEEREEEARRPRHPLSVVTVLPGKCLLLDARSGRQLGTLTLLEPEDRDDNGDPWQWALTPGMHFRTRDEDGWNLDYGTAADKRTCFNDLAQRIADYGLMDSNGHIIG